MLVKKNNKAPYLFLFIIFILIFYYMLRITTLVSYNNGIWNLEFFSVALNELYKINTPIEVTNKNLVISLGVSFFAFMVY